MIADSECDSPKGGFKKVSQYVISNFVQIPPKTATTRGSESRKGGQFSGGRISVLMNIWRPGRGQQNNII